MTENDDLPDRYAILDHELRVAVANNCDGKELLSSAHSLQSIQAFLLADPLVDKGLLLPFHRLCQAIFTVVQGGEPKLFEKPPPAFREKGRRKTKPSNMYDYIPRGLLAAMLEAFSQSGIPLEEADRWINQEARSAGITMDMTSVIQWRKDARKRGAHPLLRDSFDANCKEWRGKKLDRVMVKIEARKALAKLAHWIG